MSKTKDWFMQQVRDDFVDDSDAISYESTSSQ